MAEELAYRGGFARMVPEVVDHPHQHRAHALVQLLDAPYMRELLPAPEAGSYASSFRFSVRARALRCTAGSFGAQPGAAAGANG